MTSIRPGLLLIAALCLAGSAPPGWFPGAGLLIVPGLAALYALVTTAARPFLAVYVVGLVHFALFSWSLHHVLWAGYLAVVVLGAGYYAAVVMFVRALSGSLSAPLAFGLGVAAAFALRSVMPDIEYPHGQPVHCLYRYPWLLGPVAWGGEILANTLLAAFAAGAVDLYRSWHGARPEWGGARNRAALLTASLLVLCLVSPPAASPAAGPGTVDVVAMQPNLPPAFRHDAAGQPQFERSLVAPTMRVAGPMSSSPPDLVVWPESAYPLMLDASEDPARLLGRGWFIPLASGVRLLAGTLGSFDAGRRTPACVLVDADGALLGYHEKQRLVAAGEYIPLVSYLPASWAEALMEQVEQRMGAGVPDFRPGDVQPLLQTAAGVPFGVLICYDSAFPGVARDQVSRGARFLTVVSNESWYRGGAELDQLEAITVCRAIETGTPIVRSTMDGATLALSGSGRVTGRLPHGGSKSSVPGVLRSEISLGPGALPPLAWLHTAAAWLLALSGVLAGWRLLRPAARLATDHRSSGGKPLQE